MILFPGIGGAMDYHGVVVYSQRWRLHRRTREQGWIMLTFFINDREMSQELIVWLFFQGRLMLVFWTIEIWINWIPTNWEVILHLYIQKVLWWYLNASELKVFKSV